MFITLIDRDLLLREFHKSEHIVMRISYENCRFSHTLSMTRPSKRKTKVKEQERDNDGKFMKKQRITDELSDWGDENDSGWDDDDASLLNERKVLKPLELIWSNNTHLG